MTTTVTTDTPLVTKEAMPLRAYIDSKGTRYGFLAQRVLRVSPALMTHLLNGERRLQLHHVEALVAFYGEEIRPVLEEQIALVGPTVGVSGHCPCCSKSGGTK